VRRLAKAKVAGSNPVFRYNPPGFRALGGSGPFMAVAVHGDAARSQRFAERCLFEANQPFGESL